METLAYLHSASAYETPADREAYSAICHPKLFDGLNWRKFSSLALIRLLSLVVALVVLSVTSDALALQRGDRGTEVTRLQTSLKAAGYFNGPITGLYGSLTQDAVIRFQQAKGITADGVAGPSTLAALRSGGTPTRSSTSGSAASSSTSGALRRGVSGPDVVNLQNNLKIAGYFSGPVTGYFGSQTEAAVLRFQQASGIAADGIAGSATQTALRGRGGQKPSSQTTTGSTTPGNMGEALRRGSSGSAVTNLQQRLKTAGYYNGPLTGYYGSLTEAAIIQFQRAKGLVPDGVAGSTTLSALGSARTPTSPNNSANNRPTLRPGDSGPAVADLQTGLKAAGYYDGPITGYYGSLTEAAISRFQRAKGLIPDGIAGSSTQVALIGQGR
jgi:peptidoglycan hydrolase-like protein with peptidoglycan-binding domain